MLQLSKLLDPVLTPTQLKRLKEHQYKSETNSVLEYYIFNPFWNWLITYVPLWLAPNLITFIGFCLSILASLGTILRDLKAEGAAPQWCYLFCAVAIFIYQTLDGIDGKQARRTGTSSPLGEFFDHGCDAILVFLFALISISTAGMHQHPMLMVAIVTMLLHLNYCYHWQSYVSGILHFKTFDVIEAHYAQIATLLFTYFLGVEAWNFVVPGLGMSLKVAMVVSTLLVSSMNLCSAYYIILTRGVGKNGSTLAGTSVVSPVMTAIILTSMSYLYAYLSPSHLLEAHPMLYLTAFCFPITKTVINMMMSSMTKSPFPLLDPIMIGPIIACLNLYLGALLPELYIIAGVAAYNVFHISSTCVIIVQQMCTCFDIQCFTIPYPPPGYTSEAKKVTE